jgi:tetratricopeptide (TPR) repeat protein/tRNA A-37 threonylcarbamoyl transferase component Bud32
MNDEKRQQGTGQSDDGNASERESSIQNSYWSSSDLPPAPPGGDGNGDDQRPGRDPPGSRYRTIRVIKTGGLGRVSEAEDLELGRRVAIKEIRPDRIGYAGLRSRFRNEIRILSRVKHPNIVPIYDLVLDGGEPSFFVMPLIEGETLDQRIEASSASSNRDELFSRFLGVCDAMSHAHGKGIIHRDLKPRNVMLGEAGETWVIDWGLARSTDAGEEGNESVPGGLAQVPAETAAPDAGPPEDHDLTEFGHALGTFAYMPPEQARGDRKSMGKRSDVFSLGGILCRILTGRAPYWGDTVEKVREKANAGLLTEAWAALDSCGGAPELTALARSCLQPEPEKRPPDAKAVADRLRDYLAAAERHRREAELVKAQAQGEAEAERKALRKTRRWMWAAVAAAALLFVAVTVLAFQAQRLDRAGQELRQERDEARRQTELAERSAAEARDYQGRLLKVLGGVVSMTGDHLADRLGTLPLQKDLLTLPLKELEELERHYARSSAIDEASVATRLELGRVLLLLGQARRAQELFERAEGVAVQLLTSRPRDGEVLSYRGRASEALGDSLLAQGHFDKGKDCYHDALKYYRDWRDILPDSIGARRSVAVALEKLGDVAQEGRRLPEAREKYEECLRLYEGMEGGQGAADELRLHLAIARQKVGDVLIRMAEGADKDALDYARQAAGRLSLSLKTYEQLAAASPGSVRLRRGLVAQCDRLFYLYQRFLGEPEEARKLLQRLANLSSDWVTRDPHGTEARRAAFIARIRLAELGKLASDYAGARELYKEAGKHAQQLAADAPGHVKYRIDYVKTVAGLADIERDEGRYKEAIALYLQGIKLCDSHPSVKDHPDGARLLRALRGRVIVCDAVLRATEEPRSIDRYTSALPALAASTAGLLDSRSGWGPLLTVSGLFPGRTHAPEVVQRILSVWARELVRRGKFEDATRLAEKIKRMQPHDPDNLYDTVCIYSLCAAGAGRERRGELPPDVLAAQTEYRKRALDNLRQAVDEGYTEVGHLIIDGALAGIRSEPGYRDIIQRLKTRK